MDDFGWIWNIITIIEMTKACQNMYGEQREGERGRILDKLRGRNTKFSIVQFVPFMQSMRKIENS